MYAWLNQDDCAKVALFDATNTSKARRQLLVQRSKAEKHTVLVFIESICDDPEILSQVIQMPSKVLVIVRVFGMKNAHQRVSGCNEHTYLQISNARHEPFREFSTTNVFRSWLRFQPCERSNLEGRKKRNIGAVVSC